MVLNIALLREEGDSNMPSIQKIIEKMKKLEVYMKLPYKRLITEMNDESGHYYYGRIS